jgi:hypothetical protein
MNIHIIQIMKVRTLIRLVIQRTSLHCFFSEEKIVVKYQGKKANQNEIFGGSTNGRVY